MEIPIQNIYFLLCYAWNKLDEGKIVDVKSIDSTKLVDLFAKVLINGIIHLLKRGIDRNYILFADEINTLKGKLDLGLSYRRQLIQRGKAFCYFDELHHNILHNQILKTTIYNVIQVKELDVELKKELIRLFHYFQQINKITVSSSSFRNIRLNRNNNFYLFLLNICELIYENLLVEDNSGETKFRDFLHDEKKMSTLFEEFVRNFYRLEQREFKVYRENISWNVSEDAKRYFPLMQTDISLESINRKIIIDAKFYKDTFQTHFDKESIHSAHFNQMYAYLKQGEYKDELSRDAEGIILYPSVDKEIKIQTKIENHKITIATINLNQEWQKIDNSLHELIEL